MSQRSINNYSLPGLIINAMILHFYAIYVNITMDQKQIIDT